MKRRTLVLAGLLATTSLTSARAADKVLVIYVGGWDCPPCTRWKNDSKPGWLTSTERQKVEYVEIESPRLRDAYQERYWPEALRAIRDRLPRKSGTPRFIVVKNDKIIANEWGNGDWPRTLEIIKAAVA